MKTILSLSALLILGMIFLMVDSGCWQPSSLYRGTVIDRSYTPESTSTGVGTGVGADGNVTTVITTSTEPEKWTVIVSIGGQVVPANADTAEWSAAVKGEAVGLRYARGRFTGSNYGWYISQ